MSIINSARRGHVNATDAANCLNVQPNHNLAAAPGDCDATNGAASEGDNGANMASTAASDTCQPPAE